MRQPAEQEILAVQPVLLRTLYGKWLAVSDSDAVLRIGVVADEEWSARAAFQQALVQWSKLFLAPEYPHPWGGIL